MDFDKKRTFRLLFVIVTVRDWISSVVQWEQTGLAVTVARRLGCFENTAAALTTIGIGIVSVCFSLDRQRGGAWCRRERKRRGKGKEAWPWDLGE